MRYLNITYHMHKDSETAETCITLPMETQIANDILEHQYDSPCVAPESAVGRILSALADLQSYGSAKCRYAEERNPPWQNSAARKP